MNDQQLSAHQFPQVYQDLGYDLTKLGCIMLPIIQDDHVSKAVASTVSQQDLYKSPSPDKPWVDGIVTSTAHITLLYGLLRGGPEMKKHVDAVLENGDALPNEVSIMDVGFFDSPYNDEPYYCLVAHVGVTPELAGAHARLTFLPHIDTFEGYTPHISLAYIKKDNAKRDGYMESLNQILSGMVLTTTKELNYGGNKS